MRLTEVADEVAAGRRAAVECVAQAHRSADIWNPQIAMLSRRFDDDARAFAEDLDRDAERRSRMPLAGVTVVVKDIIATREAPPAAQSLVRPDGVARDSSAVARLRAAGAVVVAKSSTTEYAAGFPDSAKPFPPPRNPWNPERWAGGSSSGSASAVAVGAALGALGTDTGGSLRVPAAFCGVTAIVPTAGRVSNDGVIPLAPSLDRVGPLARDAEGCARLLQVMAACRPFIVSGGLAGVRVGLDLLEDQSDVPPDAAVLKGAQDIIDVVRDSGARIVAARLPLYKELSNASAVIMLTEALDLHRDMLSRRWSEYYASTRGVLALGALFSGADLASAERVRRGAGHQLREVFRDLDILITPVAMTGATPLWQLDGRYGGLEESEPEILSRAARAMVEFGAVHTRYWNATDCPVVAIPVGFDGDGMPVGLQIAARPGRDDLALRVAHVFQLATAWHSKVPPAPSTSTLAQPGPGDVTGGGVANGVRVLLDAGAADVVPVHLEQVAEYAVIGGLLWRRSGSVPVSPGESFDGGRLPRYIRADRVEPAPSTSAADQ